MTIMVKKADGTFERKTLSEISALKNQVSQPPVVAASTPKPSAPPTAPPAAVQQQSSRQPHDGETEEIIKKVSFNLTSTPANRLRTLIQLRLKDIRTVDQVEEAMLRKEDEGGVGLTDDQAQAVMKLLPGSPLVAVKKPVSTQPQKPRPAPAPVPAPAPAQALIRTKAKALLPAPKPMVPPPPPIKKPSSPTPTQPVNPINKEKVVSTFIKSNIEEPYFKTSSESNKPIMRDITIKQTNIGPINEISTLTLTDFRRLSSNPEEAAMRLKQKFINVKDESILLYIEALDAWKTSPLYTDYSPLY